MMNSVAMRAMTMSEAGHRADEILRRIDGVKNPIGAEVGVAIGQTSECLLTRRGDLRLVMVDSYLPADSQPEPYRQSGDWHARLTQAEQDAHKRAAEEATAFAADRRQILSMLSVVAASTYPDLHFDFVFIDADHSYEGASSDISAWAPKIKPGGWLCGHDYMMNGDPARPWSMGPKKAVDEFVAEHNLRLELGLNYTWFTRL